MKPTAAIFDLDGTLSDDSWRKRLILTDSMAVYHERGVEDDMINGHLVQHHIDAGDVIVFCTGRPNMYRFQTREWIEKQFPELVEYTLYMRFDSDHRPSSVVKLELINQIAGSHDIVAIYEDRKDVAVVLEGAGHKVTLVGKQKPNAADILRAGADTYRERNAVYKDNYKRFGDVMMALFPEGFYVRSAEEWNVLGTFIQAVSKLTRFSASDLQHVDSIHDLMVYAAMTEELLREHPTL